MIRARAANKRQLTLKVVLTLPLFLQLDIHTLMFPSQQREVPQKIKLATQSFSENN